MRRMLWLVAASWLGCGVAFQEGEGGGTSIDTLVGGSAGMGGTTSDTGGAGATGGGANGGGTSTGGGPMGGGGAGGELDDSDVFARYWIDEHASGAANGFLTDDVVSPLDLPIVLYSGTTLDWTEVMPGQRALQWQAITNGGSAQVEAETTKYNALYGRSTLTIEAVASLEGAPTYDARLVHLGDSGSRSALQISHEAGDLIFFLNNQQHHMWAVASGARHVFHLVFDSNEPNPDQRARLYVDGTYAPAYAIVTQVQQGSTITVEPEVEIDSFVIGNQPNGTRAWNGSIGYVAIYTAVLDPERIAHHAAVLQAADDKPP